MEDILDIYEMPYNPVIPVVCMDEKSYQILGEVRDSWAMCPGDDRKVDFEYARSGTYSILAFIGPLGGICHISVRECRTAKDWAEEVKHLPDVIYPDAEKVILVMDNLNIHGPASLYKAFPPGGVRWIIERLEIRCTPKRGGWPGIAETELNVVTGQCFPRRIVFIGHFQRELSIWERERDGSRVGVNW